jgi:hypothetical protein
MQRFVHMGVPALSALLIAGTARADDWVLRRDTSSSACRVELAAAYAVGVIQIAGPFSSRGDACNVNWCTGEGVNLPH